ncbi:nitroreductase [Aeromicrobium sp. Leaf350]|uniref:nitroreductase n=1 Tax=Aeromicrobium sp. Leaf350 TaxID=2876565 RepID=UPI001E3C6DA8|nr:nitroreductase [Aeromicrobium sp. Leaf350]
MAAQNESSTSEDASDVTVVQALAERWSCRGFLPEPVPRATIEAVLAAAQRTPSWCNTQPWQLAIFSGDAIDDLRSVFASDQRITPDIPFPPGYAGVHQERRREVGLQLYDAVGVARGDREASAVQMLRNFDFFDAPHVAVVSAPADLGPYGYVDCGLYVQSFLLAAQAHGIGTIAQAAVAMKSEVLHERIGWGEDRQVVCGISFGWPDPEHPANSFRAHRADVSDAVTFFD